MKKEKTLIYIVLATAVLASIAIITAFTILAFTSDDPGKTPQEWCEAEVIYWFEYDYPDYSAACLTTTELNVICDTDETSTLRFKAYSVIVYYGDVKIYCKTYIATIYYTGGERIPKTAIRDLDVAEAVDASAPEHKNSDSTNLHDCFAEADFVITTIKDDDGFYYWLILCETCQRYVLVYMD